MKRVLSGLMVASLVLVSACKGDEGGSSSTGTEGMTATTMGTTTEQPTTGVTGEMTSGTTSGPGGAGCMNYEAEQLKVIEKNCGCAVEQGLFPDLSACLEGLASTPEEAMCHCDVYGGYAGSDDALQCLAEAATALVACLADVACDDFDAADVCYSAHANVAGMCPTVGKEAGGKVAVQCDGEAAFMCTSGEQVPVFFTCDKEQDCMDGSDEAKDKCIFTCTDGQEVPIYAKCDGIPDCDDMSDEPAECYFMCMSGEQVLAAYVCDGVPDCMDMSDEAGDCTFMCMSGETVPKAWVCDMEQDCMDGSDEANCP